MLTAWGVYLSWNAMSGLESLVVVRQHMPLLNEMVARGQHRRQKLPMLAAHGVELPPCGGSCHKWEDPKDCSADELMYTQWLK